MTEINSDQWQQAGLWITVDKPGENCGCAVQKFPPHAPPSKEKSLSLSDFVMALDHAVELLAARLDGLQYVVESLLSVIDEPLSPAESIERLRQLREGLR